MAGGQETETLIGMPCRVMLNIYSGHYGREGKGEKAGERERERGGRKKIESKRECERGRKLAASLREGTGRESVVEAARRKGIGMACLLKRQNIIYPSLFHNKMQEISTKD